MPTRIWLSWQAPDDLSLFDHYEIRYSQPTQPVKTAQLTKDKTHFGFDANPPWPVHVEVWCVDNRGLKSKAVAMDVVFP